MASGISIPLVFSIKHTEGTFRVYFIVLLGMDAKSVACFASVPSRIDPEVTNGRITWKIRSENIR
jgi:hypothetical protein